MGQLRAVYRQFHVANRPHGPHDSPMPKSIKENITVCGTTLDVLSNRVPTAKRASPRTTITVEELRWLCVEWVELHTPKHPVLNYLMHVPNGGTRPKGEAGKLKEMGTKAGAPDFILPHSRGTWSGLAIALKSASGRLSYAQMVWLRGLNAEGYLVSVCRSLESFESVARAFLNGQAVPPPCVERGWDE
jgi:hypothetical protein